MIHLSSLVHSGFIPFHHFASTLETSFETICPLKTKFISLDKRWYQLNKTMIHSIGKTKLNPIMAENLSNYLTLNRIEQKRCFHFSNYVIYSKNYIIKTIQLKNSYDIQPFDIIQLYSKYDGILEHSMISIGDGIYMSKMGSSGIYFHTLFEAISFYKCLQDKIEIYTPINIILYQ